MARKYRSVVWALPAPGGMVRLTFEKPPLPDPRSGLPLPEVVGSVVFEGPRPVELPAGPIPRRDWERWAYGVEDTPGFYRVVDANLGTSNHGVVELPDYEAMSAGVRLRTELSWDYPGALLVTVENASDAPAPDFSLRWVWEAESPQPFTVGETHAAEVGGSEQCRPPEGWAGVLPANGRAVFTLHPGNVAAMRSRAASLSPERYWISLRCGDHELARIPGNVVGAYLEEPAE